MDGPLPTANQENSVIWPELWAAFTDHRNNIRQVLCNLSPGSKGRLCILGAGRTTDLDLMDLVNHFSQIDLVDIHPTVTHEALLQRGFDKHPKVKAIGGIDVTGLSNQWMRFKKSPSEFNLQQIIDSSRDVKIGLGQYDVVASTCLLSQILRNVQECLQATKIPSSVAQDYFPKIIKSIRQSHIELVLQHTLPGSSSVLVTDLTSAEALPEMLEANADLNRLISTEVVKGNHFPGLNPLAISEALRYEGIANKLAHSRMSAPWIWDSIESQYLCVAYRLDRK